MAPHYFLYKALQGERKTNKTTRLKEPAEYAPTKKRRFRGGAPTDDEGNYHCPNFALLRFFPPPKPQKQRSTKYEALPAGGKETHPPGRHGREGKRGVAPPKTPGRKHHQTLNGAPAGSARVSKNGRLRARGAIAQPAAVKAVFAPSRGQN